MSIKDIHFIRERIMKDYQGVENSVMEVSLSNASTLRPKFQRTAFYETDDVRVLYAKLGGSRREGETRGSTVIIPNRSGWESFWGISTADVRVVDDTDVEEYWKPSPDLHTEESRARDRLMRD